MLKRFRFHSYLSFVMQQRLAWLGLLLIVLTYALVMSDQTILRYTTFKATAFDLGNLDQAIWNTLHGRPFQFTNQGSDNYGPPIRLATHVEPIIFLLSLLYIFHADPRILLVFQTLALAAGALPVFLLTRKQLPTFPLLAPVMSAAYLVSPALLGLNLYDFHPVSLATPLLLYAVLALNYRRYAWFVLACILACACKEDIPLTVAMLGILVFWKYRLPRLGALLFFGGILWSYIAFFVVIPHFFPGAQHSNYWYRYEALGNSPSAAIVNILLHPWLPFAVFVTLDRIYYLFGLLRSTGFLALLAPIWLLPTLPSLAINLLASGDAYYSGVYHYNAAIIPFVMLSAIYGVQRLVGLWSGWREETTLQSADDESVVATLSLNGKLVTRGSSIPVVRLMWAIEAFAVQRVQLVGKRVFYALHKLSNRWLIVRTRALLNFWRRCSIDLWRRFSERMANLSWYVPVPRFQWYVAAWIIAMFALNLVIMTPLLNIFWADHHPGNREQEIEQVLALIPPGASVSAGGTLNPHLTDRRYVTVFPQITFATSETGVNTTVEYVVVDLDNISPEDKSRSASFLNTLNQLRRSHQFHQIAEADGVILLVRDNR